MNDIWNARREKLEQVIIEAALELFEHTGSGAFKIPIKGTSPSVYIVAGDEVAFRNLISGKDEKHEHLV